MNDKSNIERIKRLAKALCVEPIEGKIDLEPGFGKWWLVGCIGGDTALPRTGGCHTLPEALDAAEAWFAPEIYALDEKESAE